MTAVKKTKKRAEFGDFQTPGPLAREVCRLLSERAVEPRSVLEPTCGRGSFLVAALTCFASIEAAVGIDIDPDHVGFAEGALAETGKIHLASVRQEDFFKVNWGEVLASLPDPLLIIGNPPWITNAELGSLGSSNLPFKSNFQSRRGIDAITGKANFDISEWMLIRMLEWMTGRRSVLAVLCKTAVARKVLEHAWRTGTRLACADMYLIDTAKHFGATVSGCLLVVESSPVRSSLECGVHAGLSGGPPSATLGYRDGCLVSNPAAFERWKHLQGRERQRWRSGIKHDCSSVMELRSTHGILTNGLGESVELEPAYLYPMLKSSDLADGSGCEPRRWMLVPQRSVNEDTTALEHLAPKTWDYLLSHAHLLDNRSSSIYRRRPRFSIFGVGEYSFAPWKVAISGFYKRLAFSVIPPFLGQPVVLDDTCYFLACRSREQAELMAGLLNSAQAVEFFSSLVFWDAKRPITVALLRRLDLLHLAEEMGLAEQLLRYLGKEPHRHSHHDGISQLPLGLSWEA